MPVLSAEIKVYRSMVASESSANGGLMSDNEAISGVSSNLFPRASATDRANGLTNYRKMFFKVANPDDLPLIAPRVWQDSNTIGQDRVVFMAATQRNTQGSLSGNEPLYGMGLLDTGVLLGATSLVVGVEHGPTVIFRNGEMIRISNRATPDDSGDEVWVRINAAPVVVGDLVTLSIDTPLPVGFLSGAKVSSVLEAANAVSYIDNVVTSTSNGILNSPLADHLKATNIGSVEQNWTLTFTSNLAFDVVGDTLGLIGSGNVNTGMYPNHSPLGSPYFKILPSLLVGSWIAGDTVTFSTHPAAIPLFLKHTVPVGTAAIGNNKVDIYVDGETG